MLVLEQKVILFSQNVIYCETFRDTMGTYQRQSVTYSFDHCTRSKRYFGDVIFGQCIFVHRLWQLSNVILPSSMLRMLIRLSYAVNRKHRGRTYLGSISIEEANVDLFYVRKQNQWKSFAPWSPKILAASVEKRTSQNDRKYRGGGAVVLCNCVNLDRTFKGCKCARKLTNFRTLLSNRS